MNERKAKPGMLGDSVAVENDQQYTATFRGQGFIDGDQGGSFLSSIPYLSDNPGMELRKELHMSDLFPKDWSESEVEYEITVTAKRIEDPKQP